MVDHVFQGLISSQVVIRTFWQVLKKTIGCWSGFI